MIPIVGSLPRLVMRHVVYGAPEVVLEPGEERAVRVDLGGRLFRPEKLMMVGLMDEIRGRYKIKRSRLPLLDRKNVVAYSTIKRRASRRSRSVPGRTIVEYFGVRGDKLFTRSYLPSSVEYIHTDPLEYIVLRQMWCGDKTQMPAVGGASALFFRPTVLGNSLYADSTEVSVSLLLKNIGDIQVRVSASIFGLGQ